MIIMKLLTTQTIREEWRERVIICRHRVCTNIGECEIKSVKISSSGRKVLITKIKEFNNE